MDMRTAISNMDMRTAIIRIFEWLCLFGVYLATTIGVVVGGLAGGNLLRPRALPLALSGF